MIPTVSIASHSARRFRHRSLKVLTRVTVAAAALACIAPAAYAASSAAADQAIEAAVHGSWRSPAHVKRDSARHPVQTLEFFGIRPNMRVVEVLPGGGWYTEILAPLVRDQGQLIEAAPPAAGTSGWMHGMALDYRAKLAADPAVYGKVRLEPFEMPEYMGLGAPDSADMVVTFRNIHDMMYANVHGEVTDSVLMAFLRSAYQVLKPGGVLGIVAHRCNPDMALSDCFKLARVPQPFLIHEAQEAGFHFGGASEVNANPRDPRTAPVFYFTPALSPKSGDVAHYRTLGDADNMTLRFVKPAD